MPHGWTSFVLAWVVTATATLCQSGEWGSGFDILSVAAVNGTEREVGDEPERSREDQFTSAAFSPSPSPALQSDSQSLDKCSVHFSTSARRPRAQREELAYLQAVQHGNKAVVDELVQFVGAEVGDQSYEDVIRENIIAIQEEQKNCHGVVEKAEEDLQQQLEGEVSGIRAGMQKWVPFIFNSKS